MMTAMAKTTMEQDFALLKGQELISLRGISQKTFDLGKGRRQAISYGEPVHFSSAGKLIDIDNRLIRDEKCNTLRTTANAYETAFELYMKLSTPVSISTDYYTSHITSTVEITGKINERYYRKRKE